MRRKSQNSWPYSLGFKGHIHEFLKAPGGGFEFENLSPDIHIVKLDAETIPAMIFPTTDLVQPGAGLDGGIQLISSGFVQFKQVCGKVSDDRNGNRRQDRREP